MSIVRFAPASLFGIATSALLLLGGPARAGFPPVGDPQLGAPQVTINPGGGVSTNGSDGLKFIMNKGPDEADETGQDDVRLAGTSQYCCSAGAPSLNIGGELFGQAGPANYTAWTSLTVLSTSGSTTTTDGAAQGTGTAVLRYTATKGEFVYTMDRRVSYTFPNDFVTDSYTFTIPEGNTDVVKFYLGGDTAPGDSDVGFGIMLTTPVRSVISLNPKSAILFGIREVAGGRAFDGATSQTYFIAPELAQTGEDIGFVATPELHDAGLLVQWTLGSTPGTLTAALEQFVNFQGLNVGAQFRDNTVALGAPAFVDFSLSNTEFTVQSGLDFTFTLPAGLVVGDSATNDCGGTFTAEAGASTIVLTAGEVAATSNCVIAVSVVAAADGVYTITAASMVATAPFFNNVGTSSLIVGELCVGDATSGDSDGDNVCDDIDVCPLDNPDDSDGDGTCDSNDLCVGNDAQGDADGDGICGIPGEPLFVVETFAGIEGECLDGGVRIRVGTDDDVDGVLSSAETNTTERVCHGTDGTDGEHAVTRTSAIDAGELCAAGGVRIEIGLDDDSDGILADGEVDDAIVVCHGEDGANGTDGAAGADGTSGADGADGTDGADGEDGFVDEDTDGVDDRVDLTGGANCAASGMEPSLLGLAGILGVLASLRRRRLA